MNYIVLDLEWNQCPTGKEKENSKMPFEIIEIGGVMLNENLEQISTFNETICPKVYRYLHFKIKEISKITMTELKGSDDFKTVVNRFLDWCGTDFQYCTWGPLDLMELQRNMQFHKVKRRLGNPLIFLDIQKLFNLDMRDEKQIMSSLAHAVERLNIEVAEPFHRALNDALYTCEVMRTMNLNSVKDYYSIDCYYVPRNKSEEIYARFPTYSKFISRKFSSKEKALMDTNITTIKCSECDIPVDIKIPWFSDNAKVYYGLGYCKTHGYVRCKLKMKKNINGQVYVVKITKHTNEEGVEILEERQDVIRARRKEKRYRHSEKNE